MHLDKEITVKLQPQSFITMMLQIGAITFLIILCMRVVAPFSMLMMWGLILAIMLYPIQQILAKKISDRQGLSSTLLVLIGVLLIGVPVITLGNSFVHQMHNIHSALTTEKIEIKQPPLKVADWPLIGKQTYNSWSDAATNFPKFLEKNKPILQKISQKIFSMVGNVFSSIALLIGALIVSGIMMTWAKPGTKAMKRILERIGGEKIGPQLQTLSVATVRSVATGVLGVAFIQALLFGVGFFFAGIPAAGVLAVIVLFIGILQLPAVIVAVPAIAYLWFAGELSVAINILFTLYFVAAGLSDNILKPLLLGRGVDAPMPVILIGALGGMVAGGFIGLFLGAVLLAVGYQIFMYWVDNTNGNQTEEVAIEKTITPNSK